MGTPKPNTEAAAVVENQCWDKAKEQMMAELGSKVTFSAIAQRAAKLSEEVRGK